MDKSEIRRNAHLAHNSNRENADLVEKCKNMIDRYQNQVNDICIKLSPPPDYKWSYLCSEIWSKFEENEQSVYDLTNKLSIWKRISHDLEKYHKNGGFFVVGSMFNGFGLNHSAIDLSFIANFKKLHGANKKKSKANLSDLKHLFTNNEDVRIVQVIKSFIPILRLEDKSSGLHINVTYNTLPYVRNTYLLQLYSKCDWRIRPLMVTIKLWAKHHKLLDSQKFNSFHLTMMVISYLQCGTRPIVLPNLQHLLYENLASVRYVPNINFAEKIIIPFQSANRQSLAQLLIGFFDYYVNFNFQNNVIALRKGNVLPANFYCKNLSNRKFHSEFKGNCLKIEEPFDKFNSAKSCDKKTLEAVLAAFKESCVKLKTSSDLKSIFHATDGLAEEL
ncbi:hypothetical protein TKK_0007284 [Trichogramma kaykai]